jgi:hypothetical protein
MVISCYSAVSSLACWLAYFSIARLNSVLSLCQLAINENKSVDTLVSILLFLPKNVVLDCPYCVCQLFYTCLGFICVCMPSLVMLCHLVYDFM